MHHACKLSFVACLGGLALNATAAARDAPRHATTVAPKTSPATWFNPDDYPPDAVREAREGRVVVIVEVDPTGRAIGCNVDISSGTASLDQKTCALVMARGTFTPALSDEGKAVSGTWRTTINWTVPTDPAAEMETRITFTGQGEATVCHAAVGGKPAPDWAPKACHDLLTALKPLSATLPPYVIMKPAPSPASANMGAK